MAAVKDINFRIRLLPSADTNKAVSGLEKLGRQWDQVFGPKGEKPVLNQARYVSTLGRAWEDLGHKLDTVKGSLSKFNKEGFDGLQKFTHGVEGITKKIFNLKHAIAGTVVGGAAIYGIHKLFEAGAKEVNVRNRLRREFGEEAEGIEALGRKVALKSGNENAAATQGLIPLAEQLQAIQAGSQFRGMKRKLTGEEAEALRKKNLAFGGNLLQRVSTLMPDQDPAELGKALGDALSGPEGIRSLISTLNLSKRSRTLSTLNEKGEAFKALSPEEQKRFGVSKKGQYLEQGDLVNLLLQRSGQTDEAAAAERKKFSFQSKSIHSQLENVVGGIGESAMDALNKKLGTGATLAESLSKFLASKEGKQTIADISEGVASIASGAITIAKEVPKIASFLVEHKGTIAALAVAFGAVKVGGAVSSLAGTIKAAGGIAKLGVDAAGGFGNAAKGAGAFGLVAAAGAAGYALGTYLDEKLNLSDRISKGLAHFFGQDKEDKGVKDFKATIDGIKNKTATRVQQLQAGGLDRGHAIFQAEQEANAAHQRRIDALEGKAPKPAKGDATAALAGTNGSKTEVTTNTNLVVDGQVLAKVVEKHLVRGISNRTARGAAPVTKE